MPTTDDLVRQFQLESVKPCRDETRLADLHKQIACACEPVVRAVAASFRISLGSWVSEVAGQKLDECILTFTMQNAGTFIGFYRQALQNAAKDEYRKIRRRNTSTLDEQAELPGKEDTDQIVEMRHLMMAYPERKRRLVHALPFTSDSQKATLLVDQRQRMAKRYVSAKMHRLSYDTPSSWCEAVEIWEVPDEQLRLKREGSTIVAVWSEFEGMIDSEEPRVSQDDMVIAINCSGTKILNAAWRQRVSRCLRFIRDQLDHEEILYFHVDSDE